MIVKSVDRKKNGLAIILSMVLSFPCFSQHKAFQFGLTIQPLAGLAPVKEDGSLDTKASISAGFSAGLDARYTFSDETGVGIGIHYGLRRFEYKVSGIRFGSCIDPVTGIIQSKSIRDRETLQSISVPVWLIHRFPAHWMIGIGPEFGILILHERNREVSPGIEDPFLSEASKTMDFQLLSANLFFGKNFTTRFGAFECGPLVQLSFHSIEFPFHVESNRQILAGIRMSCLM